MQHTPVDIALSPVKFAANLWAAGVAFPVNIALVILRLGRRRRIAQGLLPLAALKGIVDRLKAIGPCGMDGDNALLNIRERATALADRAKPPRGWAERLAGDGLET